VLHVVRCFGGESVTHVEGSVDPMRDAEVIETELLLKDAETVARVLEKLAYVHAHIELF
jgi:ribosome-binding ATPase YchF (GTP1/OBG family)